MSRFPAFAILPLVSALLWGCPAPQTPYDKVNEAAREMNMAARWGRMDVALERSAPEDFSDFVQRHAKWHSEVRIVDTELAGLNLTAPTEATAQVEVSWTLDNDTTLRVTRLEQNWKSFEGKWMLVAEKRVAGSTGLFGEAIEYESPRGNRHFPTRVIHE